MPETQTEKASIKDRVLFHGSMAALQTIFTVATVANPRLRAAVAANKRIKYVFRYRDIEGSVSFKSYALSEKEMIYTIEFVNLGRALAGMLENPKNVLDLMISGKIKTDGRKNPYYLFLLGYFFSEARPYFEAHEPAFFALLELMGVSRSAKSEKKEQTPKKKWAVPDCAGMTTVERLADMLELVSLELERIQQNMDQAAQDLQESDPLAAANVADALDFARRGDLSGSMRRSGRQVQENQVAQAVKAQAQLDEQLREMQDILANRRDQELQRLVKKLREAEDQLAAMREEQAGLRKKLRQAADESDDQARRRELERLAREERRLQQEAARLARTLRRLEAQRAARRMADAAARLAASGEQGEQGNAEQAGQQAEAAERDLEQAMQELRRERQQAEADLAEEQLARLEDGLRGIRDRQAQLIEETRLYHQAAAADGLTPAQQESVRVLGRQQQFLRDETHAWAERLAAARSFELALTSAAGAMERAATLLRNLELGQDTQAAESRALARLDQILQALAPDQPPQPREGEQPEQQGEPGQQGEDQPSPQQGDGIRSVAELKLLKLLQDDLNARTRELAEALRDVPHPNPAQQQELAELSAEQGRLADLLLELTQVPDESDAGDVEPPGLDDLELDDVDQTDSDASGDDRPLPEPQGDQPNPAEHLEDLLPFPDQTAIRPQSGRIDPENSP